LPDTQNILPIADADTSLKTHSNSTNNNVPEDNMPGLLDMPVDLI
jgi:hypothetical protein